MSNLLSISRFSENGQKNSFCHFPEAPPELRMLIVNKMETGDRCRFSGSSKLSHKEAKTSKNYIYELAISIYDSEITVRHGTPDNSFQGYFLRIVEERSEKYLICSTLRNRQLLWKTQLEPFINWQLFFVEQFKSLLISNHKTIRKLSIDISRYRFDEIASKIKSFNNLEILNVLYETDIRQFLSKIRKPLKSLYVSDKINEEVLEDGCQPIFEVQNTLELSRAQLNRHQLLRLSASEVKLSIGNLNEYDIFEFVRLWQTGAIGRKIKEYQWRLVDSGFSVPKLFELFGEEYENLGINQIHIKHEREIGKVARLDYSYGYLTFEIVN